MKQIASILFCPVFEKGQIPGRKEIIDRYISHLLFFFLGVLIVSTLFYAWCSSIELKPTLGAIGISLIMVLLTGKGIYREVQALFPKYYVSKFEKPALKKLFIDTLLAIICGAFLKLILDFANKFIHLNWVIALSSLKFFCIYTSMVFVFIVLGWLIAGLAAIMNIKYGELESPEPQK